MEQHTFKNVNNCLNTNTYSYLETSGGQSYNLYINVVLFSTPVLHICGSLSFPALVSNKCCSFALWQKHNVSYWNCVTHW